MTITFLPAQTRCSWIGMRDCDAEAAEQSSHLEAPRFESLRAKPQRIHARSSEAAEPCSGQAESLDPLRPHAIPGYAEVKGAAGHEKGEKSRHTRRGPCSNLKYLWIVASNLESRSTWLWTPISVEPGHVVSSLH